jgi:hypothetical protein
MEYFWLSIPIPKRPWIWIRFRITTIMLLIAILAISLAWRRDHKQMAAEIARLKTPYPHYEPAQATGPPDVSRQGDSPLAWCPATMNAGNEWLLLDYPKAIVPTAIVLHENYTPGAVVRITHVPGWGREVTLWEGAYSPSPAPGGSVATLPVTAGIKTRRIKLYMETSGATGWEEIDAVGLKDAAGNVTWANGAAASSAYGDGSDKAITGAWTIDPLDDNIVGVEAR